RPGQDVPQVAAEIQFEQGQEVFLAGIRAPVTGQVETPEQTVLPPVPLPGLAQGVTFKSVEQHGEEVVRGEPFVELLLVDFRGQAEHLLGVGGGLQAAILVVIAAEVRKVARIHWATPRVSNSAASSRSHAWWSFASARCRIRRALPIGMSKT